MADESNGGGSEAEMGNRQGGGKKKKKHSVVLTNGNGELSDEDPEYKYVSIVDVNPSSFYESASEESLRQRIEVNSPEKINGLSAHPVSVQTSNSDLLKCNVVIGENTENGHPRVSRVSVNGSFDDSIGEPNGSSTFIEQENDSVGNVQDVSSKKVPSENLPNGSSQLLNGESSPRLIPTVTISSREETDTGSLHNSVENRLSPPNALESTAIASENGHLTPDSRLSPMEQISNGHSHSISIDEDLCSEEEKESLQERLALAVRQTLEGRDASSMDLGEDFQEEVERVVREKLKRQRSGSSDYWNHDDTDDHCIVDFLDKINDHAEARLAAKRQARAEAREIRMRELERMQRESEDGDKVYDIYSTPEAVNRCVRAGSVVTPRSLLSSNNSYHSSRRSSEDSLEEVNSIRDVRHELKELEEKFRKAMIANAQLDNEKAAFAYQVDLFKDKYEELEEQNLQLLREHKETCRQLEQTKRHRTKLQEDLDITSTQLSELHQLIQEKGLVVVEGDCSSSDEESEGSQPQSQAQKRPKKALVSAEVADVIQQGSGSLDVRLKKFVEERNELLDELRRVKMELEEERARSRGRHANGPTDDSEDIQREANKMLGDYKFKLQKAEQDVNTMQANVARLESQVVRYKSAAETSEKSEDELKLEKRKLQRELRETQARLEELETSNSHLQRRLDKLKNAKSALFKDL